MSIVTDAVLLAICAAAKIMTAKKAPLAISIFVALAFCAGMSALVVLPVWLVFSIGRKALENPVAHWYLGAELRV